VPPEPTDPKDVTRLMAAAAGGDRDAADQLLPVVYDQLRRAAQLDLARERPDFTLSATELVHEAWLKLVGPRQVPWANRGHFYAAAAEAMRRILLDHARKRERRGGTRVPLEEVRDLASLAESGSERILAVDAALQRLEADDPEAAAIVKLRFYAGRSVDEAAAATGLFNVALDHLRTYGRLTNHDLLNYLRVHRSSAVCAILSRLPGFRPLSGRIVGVQLDRTQASHTTIPPFD
jgi:RNA polymerase sigma factor (TIGR02999 family)